MIVVCGIPSEAPVSLVTEAIDELGLPYVLLNQRRFADTDIDIHLAGADVQGHLTVEGSRIDLQDVSGIYDRIMDWRVLPEMEDAADHTLRRCAQWHDAISNWVQVAPGCVMNRVVAASSNGSKPYQSQLIRASGFSVPETLVTNDPERVHEFRARHDQIVFKSISCVRSIVKLLDDDAVSRLPLIRWCPVQFQRYIPGTNVRVHTVAGDLFATRVDTDGIDYRYAARNGGYAHLTPWFLPDDVADRCLDLVQQLGLELAGIDLIMADDAEVFCLEVNTGPAFSYYEVNTGQEISRAIARALGRGQSSRLWTARAAMPVDPQQPARPAC